MAKLSILAGATSQSVNLFIQNSSSNTGAGLTGLVFNSTGLIAYYTFAGANTTSTSITLATLASVTAAYSSGGFIEIDATHMPGLYRLDLPNTVLASGKGREVTVYLSGATNMAPCVFEIELTGLDNQLALPTNFSSLQIDGSGRVTVAPSQFQIKKNTALNNFQFLMISSTDDVSPATGLTVTAQRSIDGAAFAACANAVVELGSGVYNINLAASDLNGTVITLKFTATGALQRTITVVTQA